MIKARMWSGDDLRGVWRVTVKLDGVRALWTPEGWRSRRDKPLHNIPRWDGAPDDCEVFVGNHVDTIRAVRTQHLRLDTPKVEREHLYSLDPLDPRLDFGTVENPLAGWITTRMKDAINLGHEGLVLRQGDVWLKVKPEETHDVRITGAIEGTGKYVGMLGALQTGMGDVGTGFTDDERLNLWLWHVTGHNGDYDEPLTDRTVEVSCLQLTPDGKFRHPRFVRIRHDKDAT